MAAKVWKMGKDAKAFQGAADGALATLAEIPDISDLTLTLDSTEANVSTRGGKGWAGTMQGLKSCSAEFDMLCNPGDTVYEAIRDAYLNGGHLAMAFLTGPLATAGSEGPKGDFSVTQFTRAEQLAEGITHSVVCKMTVFDEWIEDGAAAV